MPPRKIKVVDVINDIEDVPQHLENEIKSIENVLPEPIEEPTQPQPTDSQGLGQPQPVEETITQPQQTSALVEAQVEEKHVSNIKTIELVECPDCNKKMTKKSLKYSHAKKCHANKPKEDDKKEEEDDTKEEEEVKSSPPTPPPKLKRTISTIPKKQSQPIQK